MSDSRRDSPSNSIGALSSRPNSTELLTQSTGSSQSNSRRSSTLSAEYSPGQYSQHKQRYAGSASPALSGSSSPASSSQIPRHLGKSSALASRGHQDSVDSVVGVDVAPPRPVAVSRGRSPLAASAEGDIPEQDGQSEYTAVIKKRYSGQLGAIADSATAEAAQSLYSVPRSKLKGKVDAANPGCGIDLKTPRDSLDSMSSAASFEPGTVERQSNNVLVSGSHSMPQLVYAVPANSAEAAEGEDHVPSMATTSNRKTSLDNYVDSFTGSIAPLAIQPHRSIRGKGMLGTYKGRMASEKINNADLPPGLATDLDAVSRGTVFMKAQLSDSSSSSSSNDGLSFGRLTGGYEFVDFATARTVTVLRTHREIIMPEV